MSVSAIPGHALIPDSSPAYDANDVPYAVAQWRDSENAVTPRSYYGEVGRRLLRDRAALTASAVLALIVGTSLLAPIITAQDPIVGDVAARLRAIGTAGHLFGTDEQGRDVLTRL